MSHQMDSKNGCMEDIPFRVFGRNLFNTMMNRFESRWFIAIIGEVYRLAWSETSHLYLRAAEHIFLYYMVLQNALSAVDAAKQFYKVICSENNFNRFYKTLTTAEEHNIDLPVLPGYLRLQIENWS